jgi:phosphatidylethanolamine/phosphatidyl-N-methylethanolamine N-methyltransferase
VRHKKRIAPLTGQNRPLAAFDEMRRNGHRLFQRIASETKIEDDARFLKSWFDRPLVTGAVSPSGKALATMMARYVEPATPGAVIEIGPGTGPVTEALIRRGVDEARLILIEFNPDFCRLLRQRFPRARVIEGDAYALAATLGELHEPAAAMVSSLPLFTKPESLRLDLLDTAFRLMHPGSPFIQFTYATVSPMPLRHRDFEAKVSPRVWLNLPPARVWVYRHA